MKFSTWFNAAGICCIIFIGCNQPQKQESSNDDIVWKASLSYCLTKEKLDWMELKDGNELETCEIYNFKITEEKGNFRNLIKLFYDSAFSKTFPAYALAPATGLSPFSLLSQKEKEDLLQADMGRDENGNHRIKSALTASSIIGITFNHEWLYDSKANILKSSITDASLSRTFEGTPYMVSLAGLKFNNRSTDSAGFDQEVLKPEIGWASEILLPIRDDLGKGPRLRVSSRSPHDSILQKAFNGSIQYPLPVKTTFNKKLVEWIWNAARKGQLPAYYCMGKDSIGEQIPTKDMRDFGSSIDTVEEENGNEVVIKNEINPDLLSGLEIREEIAFHSNRFTFESKITYAAILLEYINKNTGKPDPNAENTVLYWVKLN